MTVINFAHRSAIWAAHHEAHLSVLHATSAEWPDPGQRTHLQLAHFRAGGLLLTVGWALSFSPSHSMWLCFKGMCPKRTRWKCMAFFYDLALEAIASFLWYSYAWGSHKALLALKAGDMDSTFWWSFRRACRTGDIVVDIFGKYSLLCCYIPKARIVPWLIELHKYLLSEWVSERERERTRGERWLEGEYNVQCMAGRL